MTDVHWSTRRYLKTQVVKAYAALNRGHIEAASGYIARASAVLSMIEQRWAADRLRETA
jgi:hypothetical protein